jgi:fructooligosaccharide transport system permease protein
MTLLIIVTVFIICLILLANVLIDVVRSIKRKEKYKKSELVLAYGLLLPAIVLAFFFVLLPIIMSLGYAFTDANVLRIDLAEFNNFENFKRIFTELSDTSSRLHISIRNTALFVVLVVPLQIGLALALAIFCNNKKRGTTIFKICFFTPVAVSLSVTCFLWQEILSPSENGFMNSLLGLFGIPKQDFLHNENTTIQWMVVMSAWQGCGYQMLIFLSALGNIRKDLYEAASIDGASKFKQFFDITLPGLKPTLLYILVTVFIGACRVMIQPMILTKNYDGGLTLSLFMYNEGFLPSGSGFGYSCAMALLFSIFIGTVTFLQRKFLGERSKK